jgi:hypothetical protein
VTLQAPAEGRPRQASLEAAPWSTEKAVACALIALAASGGGALRNAVVRRERSDEK